MAKKSTKATKATKASKKMTARLAPTMSPQEEAITAATAPTRFDCITRGHSPLSESTPQSHKIKNNTEGIETQAPEDTPAASSTKPCRKRKSPSGVEDSGAGSNQPDTKRSKPDDGVFPFLNLPQELRDQIFEEVIADRGATYSKALQAKNLDVTGGNHVTLVKRKTKVSARPSHINACDSKDVINECPFQNMSGFAIASKQLANEYNQALTFAAFKVTDSVLHAPVDGLSFDYVTDFLSRLDKYQCEKIISGKVRVWITWGLSMLLDRTTVGSLQALNEVLREKFNFEDPVSNTEESDVEAADGGNSEGQDATNGIYFKFVHFAEGVKGYKGRQLKQHAKMWMREFQKFQKLNRREVYFLLPSFEELKAANPKEAS